MYLNDRAKWGMPGGCPTSTPLPFPLRPRRQRPDPPLAEVEVAEEERLLEARGKVEVGAAVFVDLVRREAG